MMTTSATTGKSRAERRRETMVRFNAGAAAEQERVRLLELTLDGLVELLHCGNFLTELAAAHWLRARYEGGSEAERESVMAAMLAGLTHSSWKVRRACADFMDHCGDQRCVAPLLNALTDPREEVRRLALHSLTCQECKKCSLVGDFVPHLTTLATSDRSLRVRRIATGVLSSHIHDSRAVATLRRLSTANAQDTAIAARACTALKRVETPLQETDRS